MARFRKIMALGLCCMGVAGCAVHQARNDQEKIRRCVLDLYTEQIMDNLVRAANGLPIIQLDYSDLTATVTIEANGGNQTSQSLVTKGVTTIPEKTLELSRQFTNGFMLNFGARDTNQVVMRANPVLNNNEVYNAYLEFLNEPGSLISGCEPPPPGAAHIVKCCNGIYYWVPNDPYYKSLFLRLSLVTTAQRGQPLKAAEDFYRVVIENSDPITLDPDFQVPNIPLVLSKKIPSGHGILFANVKNVTRRFVLKRYQGVPEAIVPAGAPTNRVVMVYRPADYPDLNMTPEVLADQLRGQEVRVYLYDYRPQLPTTDDLLKGIQFRLDNIYINQFRQPL